MTLNYSMKRQLCLSLRPAHVDDVKIIANQQDADAFIDHFRRLYDIEDLGNDARWQGVQFNRNEHGLYMSQARHIQILLHRAGLEGEKGTGCNLQVPIREERLSKDMCCKTPADHLFVKTKSTASSSVQCCGVAKLLAGMWHLPQRSWLDILTVLDQSTGIS